jgi:hypothetical protein
MKALWLQTLPQDPKTEEKSRLNTKKFIRRLHSLRFKLLVLGIIFKPEEIKKLKAPTSGSVLLMILGARSLGAF